MVHVDSVVKLPGEPERKACAWREDAAGTGAVDGKAACLVAICNLAQALFNLALR